jgi:hypothetical protein
MINEQTSWREMLLCMAKCQAYVAVETTSGKIFQGEVSTVGLDYLSLTDVRDSPGSFAYVPFTSLCRIIAPRRRPDDVVERPT